MPSFSLSAQGCPLALPRSQVSFTQMPLNIFMSLFGVRNLLPQHHAMKTFLWQARAQLCYCFQLCELKNLKK